MNPHLDAMILAALAEGTLAREEALEARAHLRTCRSCMAAYADAVRYRAAWLARPEDFVPDAETLAAAGVSGGGALSGRSDRWRIGAAMAAVVALALVPLGFYANRAPSLAFRLEGAVRESAERSSSLGLVLPGAARGAGRELPGMRSGQAVTDPALEREVKAVTAAYESGRRGAEASARVVAALLAAGEFEAARDYADEGLEAHPRSVPLLVFAADTRYRLDDLAGAEERLRAARRVAPRDPVVALDLALVLREQGRESEARELLDGVARSGVRELADRAARETGQRAEP